MIDELNKKINKIKSRPVFRIRHINKVMKSSLKLKFKIINLEYLNGSQFEK